MSSDLLAKVWIGLGTHLWQTSLVLVVLFVVARTMRRAPAGFLNSLLWIGLVKLFVPLPLLKSVAGSAVDSIIRTASSTGAIARAAVPMVEGSAVVLNPAGTLLQADRLFADGLPVTLTVLWVAGVLAVTGAWLLRARPSTVADATPASEATESHRRRIARAISGTAVPESTVFLTRSRVVPHVAGLARPRIVVPLELVDEVGDAGLRGILLHENAHRVRREPLRLLLSRTASVAFFFYPLLWPLLRRIRETGEMACDDAVLAGGVRAETYTRALACVVDMELTAAPSSAALDRRSPSLIRRRLMRLNEPGRYTMKLRHRTALSLAVVCVLLSSLLSLSSIAGDATTDSKAPDPPDKPAPAAVPAADAEPAPQDAEPVPLPEKFDLHISKMIPPEYPPEARKNGLEAIVFMELTLAPDLRVATAKKKMIIVGHPPLEIIKVGKEGKVVEPVEEEGMDAYHEVFIKAATEAALQWQLEVNPRDTPVEETTIVVPIQFRLDGEDDKDSVKDESE